MTVFVTQSDIQLSGPGLIGSDVAGSGVRRSKRLTIGAGLSLVDGELVNSLDLSEYLTTATAASTYLPLAGGTLVGDLKFTDATYDIGKPGATRPRDGFFSRNLTVGDTYKFRVDMNSALITGVTLQKFSTLRFLNEAGNAWITTSHLNLNVGSYIAFGANGGESETTVLQGNDASDTLFQRRSTNAQTFRLAETWTSSTSFGALQLKANSGSAYQIGSAIGSAGGTNRAITFGHWDVAGTFTEALSLATNSDANFAGKISRSGLTANIDFYPTDWVWLKGGNGTLVDHALCWGPSYASRLLTSGNLTCGAITAAGDLLFTDATYDIGKSGATRPRDGFFSRNVEAGNYLYAGSNTPGETQFFGYGAGSLLVGNTSGSPILFWLNQTAAVLRTTGFEVPQNRYIGWQSTAFFWCPGNNVIEQRNSTNAQTFRVYSTYTSSTSYETINIKGKASANFEIGPENGSAGGTLRGLTIGGYSAGSSTITPWLTFDNAGVALHAALARFTEVTYTPTGTTQTITLNDGNHQTLNLTSATGPVTVTLTVPTSSSAGTIIVNQHASAAKDLTWAVSSGTIRWMGAEPDWAADAISSDRLVSWRWNGSIMRLVATDVGT